MPATPEETPSKSNMPLYPDEEQIARAVLGSSVPGSGVGLRSS
jgi:hypothetical protein